jgi:hypothetical protein
MKMESKTQVQISAPNMKTAVFSVTGLSPLVVHRFSAKLKKEFEEKQITGKAASSKKKREPQSQKEIYDAARYVSEEGWDGFQASALRHAMISACRLVSFKMTLAKMSIFVVADGRDKLEPQIELIRIIGKPIMQTDVARVQTGQPYVTIRPAYHGWKAKIQMQWDADQFTLADIANLLSRVGMQVGLCEGRPDSKNSAGMGWGRFSVDAQ